MARMLIVDDAKFQRKLLGETLKAASYDTLEAVNGRQALEIVQTEARNGILTDMAMPEMMDGMGLPAALQAQSVAIPVVVFTAAMQASTREQCQALGAFALLHKPSRSEALYNTLEQALALQREARSWR